MRDGCPANRSRGGREWQRSCGRWKLRRCGFEGPHCRKDAKASHCGWQKNGLRKIRKDGKWNNRRHNSGCCRGWPSWNGSVRHKRRTNGSGHRSCPKNGKRRRYKSRGKRKNRCGKGNRSCCGRKSRKGGSPNRKNGWRNRTSGSPNRRSGGTIPRNGSPNRTNDWKTSGSSHRYRTRSGRMNPRSDGTGHTKMPALLPGLPQVLRRKPI